MATLSRMKACAAKLSMVSDDYPYCELEVFVAGYERGRTYARHRPVLAREDLLSGELASREATIFDLTREGLLMLGMQAGFVPRDVFDAGVLRALDEATSTDD